MKTIDIFCQWWGVGTPIRELPSEIDLICLVSFGATRNRLTVGSRQVVEVGKKIAQINHKAWILSGEFTGNPTQDVELDRKMIHFNELVTVSRVISTIQEAEAWQKEAKYRWTKRLVIITDEMHSRSARRVSNRVWNGWWGLRLIKRLLGMPLVKVFVTTFPTRGAIDPESPMTALRSQWLWVRNNVARELFLMLVPFGFSIMRKLNIHQPIATDRGGE